MGKILTGRLIVLPNCIVMLHQFGEIRSNFLMGKICQDGMPWAIINGSFRMAFCAVRIQERIWSPTKHSTILSCTLSFVIPKKATAVFICVDDMKCRWKTAKAKSPLLG